MKRYNQAIELIIQTKTTTVKSKSTTADLIKKLKGAGINAEPGIEKKGQTKKRSPKQKGLLATKRNLTVKTNARDTVINPWDLAHLSVDALGGTYIEPNFTNEFLVERKVDAIAKNLSAKSFGSGKADNNFDPDWQPKENIIWHLDDKHSQLLKARKAVDGIDYPICIGHLDTGYS